jgi:hypothetical protein
MGRLDQLKKTFPANLEAAKAFGLERIEFVILNWSSNDGLEDWLKSNYSYLIDAGTLKYLATWEPEHYHMAKTKNITHKQASGEIVVNVDADSYVFLKYLEYVWDRLSEYDKPKILRAVGTRGRPAGRIACRKKYFMELGGYDEVMELWGSDDWDFTERFQRHYSVRVTHVPRGFIKTDEHNMIVRYSNYETAHTNGRKRKDYNKWKRKQNKKQGVNIVNTDKEWGILP